LRSGEDNAACAQEANGKSKPDKHVGSLAVPTEKATSAASERRGDPGESDSARREGDDPSFPTTP
jgi:hypothetical protein